MCVSVCPMLLRPPFRSILCFAFISISCRRIVLVVVIILIISPSSRFPSPSRLFMPQQEQRQLYTCKEYLRQSMSVVSTHPLIRASNHADENVKRFNYSTSRSQLPDCVVLAMRYGCKHHTDYTEASAQAPNR